MVEAYDQLAALGYCRHGAAPVLSPSGATARARAHAQGHRAGGGRALAVAQCHQTDAGALQSWLRLDFPPDWFDRDSRQRALKQAARYDSALAEYGHPQGYAPLRRYLEDWLGEAGMAVPAEHILLTQGASRGAGPGGLLRGAPGEVVLVDDPGYCNLLSCLTLRGFTVIGAPWTPHGPDTAALEQLLQTHQPRRFSPTLAAKPTGASYSPATAYRAATGRAIRLLCGGRQCLGRTANRARQTLAAMAGLARVIYIGSFSKTLSPGLRVGFVAAAPGMIDALTHAKMIAGLTSSSLAERLALAMLTDGRYRKNLERLKPGWPTPRTPRWPCCSPNWAGRCSPPRPAACLSGPARRRRPRPAAPGRMGARRRHPAGARLPVPPRPRRHPWLRFNVAFSHGEALRRFLLGYRRG